MRRNFTPEQFGQLTIPQIDMYMDEEFDKPRPPVGSRPIHSHEDAVLYAHWLRTATPQEKLDAALREEW